MAEEPPEIGRFLFSLKVFKQMDGKLEYEIQNMNQYIPIEIVIMQLKAFLNNLERKYFDTFKD